MIIGTLVSDHDPLLSGMSNSHRVRLEVRTRVAAIVMPQPRLVSPRCRGESNDLQQQSKALLQVIPGRHSHPGGKIAAKTTQVELALDLSKGSTKTYPYATGSVPSRGPVA
jgi:hypothetical protein